MNIEEAPRPGLWSGVSAALALTVLVLMGYVIYFQGSVAILDCTFDAGSGRVLTVAQNSFADWSGLQPGDIILSVDGIPFAQWQHPTVGNYLAEIERDGRIVTLELVLLPLIKTNLAPLLISILVALVFWGTGTLLLWRRPQRMDVRIFFLMAQVFAVAALLLMAHPSGVRPWWMTLLTIACFHLAAPLLLHHALTFPTPLGSPRQRRWFLGLIYGLALVMLTAVFTRNSLWIRLGVLYTTLEVVGALAALVYSYFRRASPDGRRRLRLIVAGNMTAGVPPILLYLLPSIIGSSYRMPGWMMGPFLVIAPLSYLSATARHNLFGIDRLLNRALVYALLSLGVLFLYLGPFVTIYRFMPGDTLLQMMVAVGLTLLVGFSFDRLRTRVQQVVDGVFYGGWYDYASVIERVSDTLARTLDRDRLTEVLTQQVPTLMHLHPGQLQIGEPANLQARIQPPSPTTMQFRLAFRGQTHSLWTAGPRRDGDDLTVIDRRILQTLARQAEVTLSNVLLIEALRRRLDEISTVQQQLLRSREEERTRLARDLHDGPVQALVALNLQLGLLLTGTIAKGPEPSPVRQELSTMRGQVRQLLAELRRVCADLRPPMLDALGLGAALRSLADDWSAQSGVKVETDIAANDALRALPEEIAVNLYRLVQEALTNVARHAEAGRVTLRLTLTKERLILTVQDDGRGFMAPAAPHDLVIQGHFGLAGIQERVSLIGGTLTVTSAPGQGTTVGVVWEPMKERDRYPAAGVPD